MKHLDLFSGIGGAALAVDAIWPGSEHIFCDFDKFCRAILTKRFPNSKIYADIRTITADAQGNGTQRGILQSGWIPELEQIDILTGGFPCQPFSQAGKRKGTSDNRHLWPEMLRVIRLTKPQWVIAENVRGILSIEGGMVFEQVCLDLEASGYEVQPFIIPAVAVNAPHRRDRVWFVAHAIANNDRTAKQRKFSETTREQDKDGTSKRSAGESFGTEWEIPWLEVATELCGMDDGLPAELDGLELSKSRHRVERLKGLGNAWVPQVAIEIMKGINTIDQKP